MPGVLKFYVYFPPFLMLRQPEQPDPSNAASGIPGAADAEILGYTHIHK